MKVLVFMSDNRPIGRTQETTDYNTLAAAINYQYCKIHGYDFIYHQTYYKKLENPLNLNTCVDISGNLRHASWAKLISAMEVSKGPYEIIVYIDSDCIFKDQNRSIETYIEPYKDKDIIFLTNFLNGYSKGIPLPCAGFFIFRVNDFTRKFLKEWYEYRLPERNTDLFWEQDALWLYMYGLEPSIDFLNELYKLMVPNRDIISNITVIDDLMFHERDGQFIIHVTHRVNEHRIPYFTNYILQNKLDYPKLIKEIYESMFLKIDTSKYY